MSIKVQNKMKSLNQKVNDKRRNIKELLKNSYYTFWYYHGKIDSRVALVESRTGEDLAGNMYRIAQGLQQRDIKLYIAVKSGFEEKVERLARLAGLNNVKYVKMYSKQYYYLLATAKYLFNDVVFDWKYIKKNDQVYVNTWHGTPLKNLGYDVNGEQYIMGNGQRNLLMADYIAMPNKYCADHLIDAYRIRNIYHGTILYSGYPRNQVFYDDELREKIRNKLGIEKNRVYVYMPTWRGSHNNTSNDFVTTMDAMFAYLDIHFESDQILYVKLHNMMRAQLDLSSYTHIREFPAEYEPYEVLNCADCLITDYSSVFFDYASTKRKIVLFVPDKEEYLKDRGMYMSIDDLPFPQVNSATALLDELNDLTDADYSQFIREYCSYDGKGCTEKLLNHVLVGEKCCLEEHMNGNDKKNIAIYVGNAMLKNGITTSLLNLLKSLDTDKYNVYFTFYRKTTTASCDFFSRMPQNINIYSISSTFFFTFFEKCAFVLQDRKHIYWSIIQKKLDKMYHREIRKLFYDCPFDVFVHFEGYGSNDSIPLFQKYPKKKIIFVHNDMIQEMKTKKNQSAYILDSAYKAYDKVAVVSPDLIEPTIAAGAPREKIVVVNNTHDTIGFRRKALEPIIFDKDTECRTFHPGGIQGVLDSAGKKFITVGRFSPEKGHQRLLKAFDRFCDFYPDTQLIIIGGQGVLYGKTLTWISKMKHWKNVTLIKSISNPMPIVSKCDLFMLPSLYEGLGLVLLEADCVGVPSFATRIVGPERLYEGFDGYLVENSENGILQGMYDFMDGKVSTLNIDYEKYNKRAVTEFESLFMEMEMKKEIIPAFEERNIPIVFSSNDIFVPIMATMIQSIIENSSPANNYDIIILTRDISMGYEQKLMSMVKHISNFSIRIINVASYVQGYNFYTENRESISVETYFRLILPDLLTQYKKVLYLDGDMVVTTDVAELYNTDLSGYLLASSRDADGIGRCYKPNDSRKEYRTNILKLKSLDNYFCAGMLLMNLERFREELPTKKLLDFAVSYNWQWHDQDVLNVLCEDKVKLLHMKWDVLRDAGNNRYMPEPLYTEFLESERDPKIIHYGGMRKPWLYENVERGEYFWRYAGRTPFYQEILKLLKGNVKEIPEKQIKDIALAQFGQGKIGPRYIVKYCRAWLKYKISVKKG